MTYTNQGTGGAAIQYANPNGGRVVNLAFPFETITTEVSRNAVMSAVLNFFALGVPGGALSGRVVRDVNGDGIHNASEIGLSGWTVFLDGDNDSVFDPGETNTTTDANGDWQFADLPPATYNVRVAQQTGWLRTNPAGGVHVVTVTSGSSTTLLNFTEFKTGYTGTSNFDQWTLRTDPANTARVQIIETFGVAPSVTWSIAKSLLSTLSFDGAAGDDTLTIDHALASPIPGGGVTYTGGANTAGGPGDQLIVAGTASGDIVSASGAIVNFGGIVNQSGLERITLNLLGGDDILTYSAPTAPLTFNGGASSTSDSVTLNSGTWTLDADAIAGTNKLEIGVNSGAAVVFNATQHLSNLVLAGGDAIVTPSSSGGAKVIVTKNLSIVSGASRLDLADNDLIVDYSGATSPMSSLYPRLVAARRIDGDWLGDGIGSSSVTEPGVTGLAIAEARDAFSLAPTDTAVFAGETVDATAVLIKYTYVGDVNLDGQIDAADYGIIDNFVQFPGANGYWNGDVNYDNVIDAADYGYIDNNIQAQGAPM
jgi:hypothetical protein